MCCSCVVGWRRSQGDVGDPGGFKRPTETLDEAAKRELAEETGVDSASLLTQFGAYGDPGRDPRMNVARSPTSRCFATWVGPSRAPTQQPPL